MLGMLMAAGEASNQVPFWLQVTSIALAPILGFLGVSVGVMMKDRSDRRNALRSDRLGAYMELLAVAAELWHVHNMYIELIARQDGRAIAKTAEALEGIQSRLGTALFRVDLIGSSDLEIPAERIAACLAMHLELMNRATSEPIAENEINDVADYLGLAVDKFRDAAVEDLGIPKAQRRRLSVLTDDPLRSDDHPAFARFIRNHEELTRRSRTRAEKLS